MNESDTKTPPYRVALAWLLIIALLVIAGLPLVFAVAYVMLGETSIGYYGPPIGQVMAFYAQAATTLAEASAPAVAIIAALLAVPKFRRFLGGAFPHMEVDKGKDEERQHISTPQLLIPGRGPSEPIPTGGDVYTIVGKTIGESGSFDRLVGTDAIASAEGSRLVIPSGMNVKLWMRHESGPKLTVHFPYTRDGNIYDLEHAQQLTTSEEDNEKGPLTFRSFSGREAVWFVFSGANRDEPSKVAFIFEFVESYFPRPGP
jgi:hypothetical protein